MAQSLTLSMATASNLSLANRVLAALPAAERSAVLERCELVELKAQAVLLEAGQAMEHAWFPIEGFVSLTLPLDSEPPLEVGLIGDEGMFNPGLALGRGDSAFTCTAQAAGRAFRIVQADLHALMEQLPTLRQVLLGYVDVRHRQLARQAACLKHHAVEQRLARWLLMARDRAHASEFFLTHEALALMLGARRESVTQAARRMQLRGHISYSRGYMMLHDEAALTLDACSCYGHDRDTYEAWWLKWAPPELTSKSM